MLRLAHRLYVQTPNETLREGIAWAEVVVCDEVAALYGESEKQIWHQEKDFPCLVPPFPVMFLEWEWPARWNIDGEFVGQDGMQQGGVLLLGQECSVATTRDVLESERFNGREHDRQLLRGRLETAVGDRLWVVRWYPAWSYKGQARSSYGQFHLTSFVDSRGRWLFDTAHVAAPDGASPAAISESFYGCFINVAMLSLSFMHCKNITFDAAAVGPDKKWLRRKRAPEITYRTLVLEPMKRVLRSEGRLEETGLKKALHICRGHFRSYDESGPGLFGRLHGTFWVPSHARGSQEHGAVVKDYSLKANPKEDSSCPIQ